MPTSLATLNPFDVLDTPYPIAREHGAFFREHGYIKLRDVLSPDVLQYYGSLITEEVIARNPLQDKPMAERTTYEKAFLQIINLWRTHAVNRRFVFSARLAQIATQLMGVQGVRLYHDQALYKEPGGGITPWHADQFYWPLGSPHTCTVWIPLQATPLEMGPLAFSVGSHRFEYGRTLAISDESEAALQQALDDQDFKQVNEPFDLGEVSFHSGWTFHRAGPNTTDQPRAAMTIIYMADGIRLIEPQRNEHRADAAAFLPGLHPGDKAASSLNPLLYHEDWAKK
jgi:ectoine hydroxylase-related dioxygenase (phytanoyl-CoA dioxygenase family)